MYIKWFKAQIVCEECGKNHSVCEICGRYATYAVDHKIPHRGDEELFWRHSNHQGLCQSDHNRKSQSEILHPAGFN